MTRANCEPTTHRRISVQMNERDCSCERVNVVGRCSIARFSFNCPAQLYLSFCRSAFAVSGHRSIASEHCMNEIISFLMTATSANDILGLVHRSNFAQHPKILIRRRSALPFPPSATQNTKTSENHIRRLFSDTVSAHVTNH